MMYLVMTHGCSPTPTRHECVICHVYTKYFWNVIKYDFACIPRPDVHVSSSYTVMYYVMHKVL